jgi:integrase
MPLSDTKIKNAKSENKRYKLTDGGGLYLEVTPAGGKLWRYKYRFNGKAKLLALGKYPDVSLKKAREDHQLARQQLANGHDPAALKQQKKLSKSNTFKSLADQWWKAQKARWTPGHAHTVYRRLETDIFPWLGDSPINDITTKAVLAVLRKAESRGVLDTAHRLGQMCNNIFLFAVASGVCDNNPAADISKALKVVPKKNFPAITEPDEITELLKAIEGFQGSFIVYCALRFAPLVFVRAGELRKAEWSEIDFDHALWSIPASRMKIKRDHLVPLSDQALAILQELHPLTGKGTYVFPTIRTQFRPMSENTINAALRRLGYGQDEMCAHGFRTMASTRLHELGWPSRVIEMQLAHVDRNKVRGIYNRAEYLNERIRMMQAWADYLDSLKAGAKVLPFQKEVNAHG